MNYLKIFVGIFIALAASRFVPHPWNFTSLLALSFYVPAVFGIKFIPVIILSLIFTDFIIGLHPTMIFTSVSVLLIGIISKYFNKSLLLRISGALSGAIIFYIITNFGVWLGGSYGFTLNGILNCYTLALPFFGYSMISTLVFSILIETVYRIYQNKIIKIL